VGDTRKGWDRLKAILEERNNVSAIALYLEKEMKALIVAKRPEVARHIADCTQCPIYPGVWMFPGRKAGWRSILTRKSRSQRHVHEYPHCRRCGMAAKLS